MVDVPRSIAVTTDTTHKRVQHVTTPHAPPRRHSTTATPTTKARPGEKPVQSIHISSKRDHDKSPESDDGEEEPGTQQLLAYAAIRVQHQKLKEEMKALKALLASKDEQIVQLTGQLRRATVTKCDLVVACTDMERQMEMVEKYGSPQAQQVKQQYLEMLEGRATMELEFMNELQALTNELLTTDRRYMNQLVDKDFTIGQLEEQVRRLTCQLEEVQLAEQTKGVARKTFLVQSE
jgi:cyanate lyase